jgi:hypothetical protein
MGWAFSPAMDYADAGRWTGALTPRVFSGPLLDSLQWDDTTWSLVLGQAQAGCEARHPTPSIWSNRESSALQ